MDNYQVRQQILELINQMLLSPSEFCYRWDLDYEALANICGLSKSTTYHWLGGQDSRRIAGKPYQRLIAIVDLLLENATDSQVLLLRYWLERR